MIGEIEVIGHAIALGIEGVDVVVDLVAWDGKSLELPLDAHEEHSIVPIHILIQIYDVASVVGDEACNLCNNALLIGTIKQQNGSIFSLFHLQSLEINLFSPQNYKKSPNPTTINHAIPFSQPETTFFQIRILNILVYYPVFDVAVFSTEGYAYLYYLFARGRIW